MIMPAHDKLSRREREIMDALFALGGKASAEEIRARLTDPPSYSAVRAMLRLLEEKGHVRHEQDGPRYVFLPTVNREKARRSAMRRSSLKIRSPMCTASCPAYNPLSKAKRSSFASFSVLCRCF